jgi:hypothetical protein
MRRTDIIKLPSIRRVSSRQIVLATGGNITYTDVNGMNPRSFPYDDGYVVHTFLSNGTLYVPSPRNIECLLVGGGGGGGGRESCGGGGAGQVLFASLSLVIQSYSIVRGGGGAPGNISNYPYTSSSGTASTFAGLTAAGGGYASSAHCGVSGNGFSGPGTMYNACGGGGGASEDGDRYISDGYGGQGGDGLAFSISGTLTYYGGGGGGGGYTARGAGGLGGGGNNSAPSGIANTGGGAASSRYTNGGGTGGSGIVIVRYRIIEN